jgi:sec-independent protein translocase protein TatC
MARMLPRRLGHEEEASLVEHLAELRHRLFICLGSIIPAFALAYAFHDDLIERLKELLPPGHQNLVAFGVTEPFITSLKVSFYAAIALVAPAVKDDTQRVLGAFVVLSTALFATGLVFCYVIVLPRALTFLVEYDSDLYTTQIRASYYLSFVALTLLAFGIAFEMPIFVLALVRLGVLSSARLRSNRRVGYVVMLVFAILLPTVDPVSLVLEVAPLLVLYELSIWLSVLMERRWERSAAQAEAL